MPRNVFLLFTVLLILILQGCLPKPVPAPAPDLYGCERPPPDIFTSAGIDLKFAESTFGKVVTGEINVETDPQVISLATKAVMNERIRSYLRCLSMRRDKYTPEQAAYFHTLSVFMQTNPNAEQFLSWQANNRFPSQEPGKTIESSNNISITPEYPQPTAGEGVEAQDFIFRPVSCRRSAGKLICTISFQNNGNEERTLFVYGCGIGTKSYLVDDLGNQYRARVYIGRILRGRGGGSVKQKFVPKLPVNVQFVAEDIAEDATHVTATINIKDFKRTVTVRDIPITK